MSVHKFSYFCFYFADVRSRINEKNSTDVFLAKNWMIYWKDVCAVILFFTFNKN